AGAYEKLAGTLRFAVDPTHPLHAQITDLRLAPRAADGRVEFQSDFYLLRPVDPGRGNRRLLLDTPNPGRKVALGMFNSAVRVPDPTAAGGFRNGVLGRRRRGGRGPSGTPRAAGGGGRVRWESGPTPPADVLPMADRYHIPYAAAE